MHDVTYTTIGGYIRDGAIYCCGCVEDKKTITSLHNEPLIGITQAELDADFPEGLWCDVCNTTIVTA